MFLVEDLLRRRWLHPQVVLSTYTHTKDNEGCLYKLLQVHTYQKTDLGVFESYVMQIYYYHKKLHTNSESKY